MLQKTFTFLIALTIFLHKAEIVSADNPVAGASAQLAESIEITNEDSDYREIVLRQYLEGHNSPLSEHAGSFVAYADEYGLDWRLVPAISGVESTFGKHIPYKSYNAYGWANGKYAFSSWDQSIEVVSQTLREKYLDRGATNINLIARRYAPPSPTWSWKVKYFMNEIDTIPVNFNL